MTVCWNRYLERAIASLSDDAAVISLLTQAFGFRPELEFGISYRLVAQRPLDRLKYERHGWLDGLCLVSDQSF